MDRDEDLQPGSGLPPSDADERETEAIAAPDDGHGDTLIGPEETTTEPGSSETAGTPAPEEPPATPEKRTVTELLYGVITKPVESLRYVAEHKLVAAGIIIYIAVSWIGAIASIPGTLGQFEQMPDLGTLPPFFNPRTIILLTIAGAPIFSLITLVISAGILHLIALLLKGKGDYPGILSVIGFASFPMIMTTPFGLIDYVAYIGVSLYSLVTLPFTVWTIVLTIIGIRENYGFSTARAIWTFFIPIIVVILLLVLLIISIVALFVGALSGS